MRLVIRSGASTFPVAGTLTTYDARIGQFPVRAIRQLTAIVFFCGETATVLHRFRYAQARLESQRVDRF
jgi:hypothetical protein